MLVCLVVVGSEAIVVCAVVVACVCVERAAREKFERVYCCNNGCNRLDNDRYQHMMCVCECLRDFVVGPCLCACGVWW